MYFAEKNPNQSNIFIKLQWNKPSILEICLCSNVQEGVRGVRTGTKRRTDTESPVTLLCSEHYSMQHWDSSAILMITQCFHSDSMLIIPYRNEEVLPEILMHSRRCQENSNYASKKLFQHLTDILNLSYYNPRDM